MPRLVGPGLGGLGRQVLLGHRVARADAGGGVDEAADDLLRRRAGLRRERLDADGLRRPGRRIGDLHRRRGARHRRAGATGPAAARAAAPTSEQRARLMPSAPGRRTTAGRSGSGELVRSPPAVEREREPELGAGAGLAPDLQPAAVQAGVLEADRQPEAAAADGADPGGVGAPEPVEDVLGLGRAEAHAEVADGHRGRGPVGGQRDLDRLPGAVLDGVADQVAQDPLHPAGVDVGDDVLVGPVDHQLGVVPLGERPHAGHHPGDQGAQVDRLGVQHRGAGVVAADLQQVGEQPLEAVELGPQQLRGPGDVRREVLARVVQHVGGHLHRGQRGAQLVGDVGGEPLLQLGEPLQLGDLPLQAVGHGVEAGGQPGQVVLAAHGHALLELPLGEPLGDARGAAHRVDDQPGDQHADADDEQRQRDPADDDRAADQGEALLLLVEGEGVVQLDLLAAGRVGGHGGADQQRRLRHLPAVGHHRVAPGLAAVVDRGAQVGRQGAPEQRPALGAPGAARRSGGS